MTRFARAGLAFASLSALAVVVAAYAGCSSTPRARASRIQSREELIGGRRALGEVGDYKLSNGLIHAIVQDIGHSRGFGAFGGSLIDVDLVRGGKQSSATGVAGNDGFTEMFPAFFLEAIEPSKVEVVADGSAGGAAIVRVSGKGGEFLSLAKSINDLVLPAGCDYQVDYILEPGKQYLKIVTTIINTDKEKTVGFPLVVPFGLITLLGEGQRLFVPGKAGYDMRFRLEELYKQPSALEALPGEVAPLVATEGEGVSYGLAASPRGAGYLNNPTYYPTAKPDSLLIPVAAGSFLGTMWGKPRELPPGKSYSYTGFLAVGTGDVASVQKVIYGIDDERSPIKTGTLFGRVREELTGAGLAGVAVVIQDSQGEYVSSARTGKDGSYTAWLPPGSYRAIAVHPDRASARSGEMVELAAGGKARVDLSMPRPAYLSVSVWDEQGGPLPAKISVQATYQHEGDEPPREFLYDLRIGEKMRPSDLEPDREDPATRRYLERVFFAPSGSAGKALRPGSYRIYASRGIEYELASQEVELKAGEQTELSMVLRQLMPTPGWASADLHVHSAHSVDSDMGLADRVASYAVEGVDYLSSTDHNFVSDFRPALEAQKLQRWVRTTVGLELTTLEMGHFNAFPLILDPGPVTHGSLGWFRRPPEELFNQLRCPHGSAPGCLGHPKGNTLLQVNHPRDSILGYFTAFNLGSYTGAPLPNSSAFKLDQEPLPDGSPSPYRPENFRLGFELLEVFNGKQVAQLFHYRMPEVAPPGPEPEVPRCPGGQTADCLPGKGQILEELIKVPDPARPGSSYDQRQPAFPGALEDWYTLLKEHQITGVGNSDSHSAAAEAGLPRSYVQVGPSADGSMEALDEDALLDGLKAGRVVVTNGPFVELTVNGQQVGSQVVAPDGTVEVRVVVKAAPWVDVSKVVLRRGGRDVSTVPPVLAEIAVPSSTELVRLDEMRTFEGLPDDSFLVAEVSGSRSLWPVYTPYEIESVLINEALSAVGTTFGFTNKYGKYGPKRVQQLTPFAFTNPIRVVRSAKQGLRAHRPLAAPGPAPKHTPRRIPDLRRLFGALHSDVE